MSIDLHGKSLCRDDDLSRHEIEGLLDLAQLLRSERRSGRERQRLSAKAIVCIFEKTSTRTRAAFEVAAIHQGAYPTYLGPGDSQFGVKESIADSAKVLGRIYDAIEFRGFSQETVESLAANAGVPVYNGLTDTWHPTQALADLLTIRDHSDKPLSEIKVAYVGDATNNVSNSLLVSGASVGLNVRIGAPKTRQPPQWVLDIARSRAQESGSQIAVFEDPHEAVWDADFIYTDVWVSLGEPDEIWEERVRVLSPYQVNASLMAAANNAQVKFLHCLPAFHDTNTTIGASVFQRTTMSALEVTDEVFLSPASVVFDQAENRLHTIKALLVATLNPAG